MDFPTSWPLTVKFLVAEQTKLEQLPLAFAGLLMDAYDVDRLCLQYASKGEWPDLSKYDRELLLQRFLWARKFCASVSHPFRKADGSETGHIAYPNWKFEPMMVWLLIEIWHLRESIPKDGKHPLPPRPSPTWLDGPATN